ncbi:hypothetical protein CGI90_26955, partial [Vibrio parahaemolyticus]|uniref:hypothetical protein n=1 Tax=Vibrio parahaemolyticus TaxID=670 RepID=UPI0011726433
EIDSRLFLNVDFLKNTEKFKIHSNIDFDFITFKSKRLNLNGGDFNQATLIEPNFGISCRSIAFITLW